MATNGARRRSRGAYTTIASNSHATPEAKEERPFDVCLQHHQLTSCRNIRNVFVVGRRIGKIRLKRLDKKKKGLNLARFSGEV